MNCPECGHPKHEHDQEMKGAGLRVRPEYNVHNQVDLYQCTHYAGMGESCGCEKWSRLPLQKAPGVDEWDDEDEAETAEPTVRSRYLEARAETDSQRAYEGRSTKTGNATYQREVDASRAYIAELEAALAPSQAEVDNAIASIKEAT